MHFSGLPISLLPPCGSFNPRAHFSVWLLSCISKLASICSRRWRRHTRTGRDRERERETDRRTGRQMDSRGRGGGE